ncbi:TPR Domain containing protein [Histomonas meleagridis]|uniref:TPR Domain containing protein n=1 Tax=Histomonas meleagridis TaxID=135588 RepID=UPI003559D37B|nr:TPR Domain containing protein [Histomonas meleagridis]KAH0802656.1 TPR Domain containing protein [Histomonas meleagridis]
MDVWESRSNSESEEEEQKCIKLNSDLLNEIDKKCVIAYRVVYDILNELGETETKNYIGKHSIKYDIGIDPHQKGIVSTGIDFAIQRSLNEIKYSNSPQDYQSKLTLGYCYLSKGDYIHSFEYFSQIPPQITEKNVYYCYSMGILQSHFQHYSEAIHNLEKIIKLNQRFDFIQDVFFRLGILCRICKRYEESSHYFDLVNPELIGLEQNDLLLQLAETFSYIDQKKLESHEIYKTLRKNNPNNLQVVQQYCIHKMTTEKDLSKIKTVIDDALSNFGFDPLLYFMAGLVCLKLDDINNSHMFLSKCYQFFFYHSPFWFCLGNLYLNNKQYSNAQIAFQRALQINIKFTEAWLNLGLTYELEEFYDKAAIVYEVASANTNDSEIILRLKKIYTVRNNPMKTSGFVDLILKDYFVSIPDQFAFRYLSEIPIIPRKSYYMRPINKKETFTSDIATLPMSLFASQNVQPSE